MECRVCVIGGGSGGIGAAIGAASRGASVVLVEKNGVLGGTITQAWVHTWEPTCGTSPLCRRLWDRMQAMPGGTAPIDYDAGSSRNGPSGKRNPPLPFEPWAFLLAVDAEFREAGVKAVLPNTPFAGCRTNGRLLESIQALGPGGPLEIRARVFIDATADIHVARAAGCKLSKGAESRDQYGEPHAPEKADPAQLNAMNWCYRVRVGPEPVRIAQDGRFPPGAARPHRFEVTLGNGDILVNPCGMVHADPGDPEAFAMAVERARMLAWEVHRWTVQQGGHPNRILVGMAPEVGVRESWRLVGRYVLVEQDLVAGRAAQKHRDIVATSDHPLDMHGKQGVHMDLKAYGVPFRCLQAAEYDNLLVACRGASFSHIAASSCRLSRTLMTLGEAAGAVAAEAVRSGKLVEDVEVANVVSA